MPSVPIIAAAGLGTLAPSVESPAAAPVVQPPDIARSSEVSKQNAENARIMTSLGMPLPKASGKSRIA